MGRHHVKLPDHLYLSPPSPRSYPSSFASATSLLSLRGPSSISTTAIIEETSSTARVVGSKIPGFQASAAFFTTLRANIKLISENSESLANTPDILHPTNLTSSVSSLPPQDQLCETTSATTDMSGDADAEFAPRAALNLPKPYLKDDAPDVDAAESTDPNEIPELNTFPANDEENLIEALRLVADSVAQQRQRLSRLLIFHPISMAFLVVVFGVLYRLFYKGAISDFAIIGTSFFGVMMAMLVAVRAVGGGYIEEAERVGTWRWLNNGRSRQAEEESGKTALGLVDEVLVTKFGQEWIGAVVFRGVSTTSASTSSSRKSGSKKSTPTDARTEIRAWTVRGKYRGKGVGTALLEDAIKAAGEKGWLKGGIDLAEDHANSKRILPATFNGSMDRDEKRARDFIQKKLDEFETNVSVSGVKKGTRRRK